MPSQEAQVRADREQLARLGYRQQLTRALGFFQNFAVGFTFLSPVVGVYSLFALGLVNAGPAFIWTIPLVVGGQLLVALTFAEVASQYPIAGSIYQWTRKLIGDGYAWFAGWLYMWALLVTIAATAAAASIFLGPLFGFEVTRTSTTLTAIVLLVLAAGANLTGVRRLGVLASAGVVAEVVGTIILGVLFFTIENNHGPGTIFHTAGVGAGGYAGAFLSALLFGVFIFYGFEACADVAEEVVDPSRKVPRAMIMSLLVGGATAFFITFSFILAVPSIGDVISGKDTNPILTVFQGGLGTFGAKLALIMVLIAFASCLLAAQAAATRMIYSYARDGMIVGHRLLSAVSERFHMPPGAVAVSCVIPAAITLLPTATIARIISFAAVGTYLAFGTVTVASVIAKLRGWHPAGAFRLGRWSWPVHLLAIAYQLFAIIVLSDKTPPVGQGFFDRWFVPISAAIVVLAGAVYFVTARPKRRVSEQARAGAPGLGDEAAPELMS